MWKTLIKVLGLGLIHVGCHAQMGELYFSDLPPSGPVADGVKHCPNTAHEFIDRDGFRRQWQPSGVGIGYSAGRPYVACFGSFKMWHPSGALVTDTTSFPKVAEWGCAYGESAGGLPFPQGFEGYSPSTVLSGPILQPLPGWTGRTSYTCACHFGLQWNDTYKYCTPPPPTPPPTCPVAALQSITDPVAREHEEGRYVRNPDMDNVTVQVRAGAACVVQTTAGFQATARITSGFRPPAYQAHLREVWDKWKQLVNNSTESCRAIKMEVQAHWVKHGLVRQPVRNSNHSSGGAVDIAGVPAAQADLIAAECNMFRPEPVEDPVHFQPR